MRSALLVVALLFSGYSWSVPPVSGKAETSNESKQEPQNHNKQSITLPSSLNPNISGELKVHPDETRNSANQESSKWIDPLTWFTFLLVIVGALQARFLFRTLKETAIAANAAKDSADAAKAASDALPLVERAYVFISDAVCPFPDGYMTEEESIFKIEYFFKNHGRTPAILKDWRFDARYIPSGCPGQTSWGKELPGITVIGSDKSSGPHSMEFKLRKEDFSEAKFSRNGKIFFWGRLKYLDIFERDHETLWCCEWNFRFNKFVISDCPELNRYT